MNLKELSDILGLSQTTVSRALNGYPEVSEATRRKVQAAAAAHNYRPNTRAKALATGRAMAIGHVIPISTKHEMVNPVFADFLAGAGESYAKAGYDMHLSLVADDDQEHAFRELAAKRNVDGLIVHAPLANEPRIPLLREIGLPFVVHGRSSGETGPYSWLDINNRRAFSRATGFLCDLGHRRVALINGLEHMDFALRRRDGYVSNLIDRGITPDPAMMEAAEMTEINGHHSARAMLDMDNPPTAFLVSSMISAMGVRRAIEERGLVMGRDVSVIAHDDDLSYFKNSDGVDVPMFTATRSSVREAGRQAADMLLTQISHPFSDPENRLLEAELTLGQSTAPPPSKG
ncbi:LacI family transcriptional regulator [Actibacterium mucosum KCTC 23349]|uniref:LacI family transcriptional regulator n=1 Tax=Actibacterium mucosum KCTC 23349 TaxID=1454373 RepID=A0A037ZH21_9RHOB|nr:substrate-binding domain-containing protein [Actibacterium mucosum]KAJ55403.1 LacI family transcriptional regulator [Actibacterium mucosum KCTC 23349]